MSTIYDRIANKVLNPDKYLLESYHFELVAFINKSDLNYLSNGSGPLSDLIKDNDHRMFRILLNNKNIKNEVDSDYAEYIITNPDALVREAYRNGAKAIVVATKNNIFHTITVALFNLKKNCIDAYGKYADTIITLKDILGRASTEHEVGIWGIK